MRGAFEKMALGLSCFLGLTACGSLGDAHGDHAASKTAPAQVASAGVQNYPALTIDQWLGLSRSLYQEGKYVESIGAAQTVLYMKPDYAEAYNNIGAAYAALRMWDPAIEADQQAVRLNPGMQLARNNLAWAITQKSIDKR
jgi:tetratricopeptide (TPR) repeat protein